MGEQHNVAMAILDFLECAYAWDIADDKWMAGVLSSLLGIWGRPDFGFAHFYDASSPERLRIATVQTHDLPTHLEPYIVPMTEGVPRAVVETWFLSTPAGFGTALGIPQPAIELLRSVGKRDLFGINALDPEGRGLVICIGTAETHLDSAEIGLYYRLSAHLASAYRCRRRLAASACTPLQGAEAVLDERAQVLDAVGPAAPASARSAVTNAVRAMLDARRRVATGDPSQAWRPRIRTRWTLIDATDSGGERYIVARENQASTASLQVLTERERQVVASAAYGRSNKEIAYDLGISHSTARVLLARACGRLGVRSRAELLALPAVRAMRSLGGATTTD
jgi:DNA-binding CsgD family transcriptional regulator